MCLSCICVATRPQNPNGSELLCKLIKINYKFTIILMNGNHEQYRKRFLSNSFSFSGFDSKEKEFKYDFSVA